MLCLTLDGTNAHAVGTIIAVEIGLVIAEVQSTAPRPLSATRPVVAIIANTAEQCGYNTIY
jgi:hypothetical protein